MLSEDSINRLAQPIVTRQQAINTWVLEFIAKRIKEIGELKPSDIHKLVQLRKMSADAQKINEELARQTSLQVLEIKRIIQDVAENFYLDAKPFYDYREMSFIPFEENTILKRRVEAIARQTANTYVNMSKAQAFMIRDLRNPSILVPTSASETYQSVVDEAIQAAQSGVIDYNTAMRRTVKQLAESGLKRVEYHPEKWVNREKTFFTQRMDTAVRRNILDGIRSVNQEMQKIVGEQFGADGYEITVHMNPAPDHAEMQGHQYTKEEFEKMQDGMDFKDVQGRQYKGFDRAVGTLNCRHFAISIIVGHVQQSYTDEQLQKILKKNQDGYTLPNGKHLTMYQCTQKQRQLETLIRYAKDGQITARASGDIELAQKYQAKINKYTSQYKAFSKACGLSEKPIKMSVSGYHKIKVK